MLSTHDQEEGDGVENECDEPGYSCVWDNVQIQTKARHQTRDHNNQFKMWALTFAARNRVSFNKEVDNTSVIKAKDIPLSLFLPSNADWNELKETVALVLEPILKAHMSFLGKTNCSKAPVHEHIDDMNRKSEIGNLGVVEENPSSTPGTIKIMEYLHKFVPSVDKDVHPIPCFGDGLSVERMCDAKRARAGGETPIDRLEGLIPCPQEFHRRGLLLQDSMNELQLAEGHYFS